MPQPSAARGTRGERHEVDQREEGDDAEVPEEVAVEADLGGGAAPRAPIGVTLGGALAAMAAPIV